MDAITLNEFQKLNREEQENFLYSCRRQVNRLIKTFDLDDSPIYISLKVVYDETTPTCVFYEGKYINRITLNCFHSFDYAFENHISLPNALQLLCVHELGHIKYNHKNFNLAHKDINHDLLNIAADLEVNSKNGIKKPGLIPEDYNLIHEQNAEYYLKEIIKQMENESSNKNGDNQTDENDDNGNNDTNNENSNETNSDLENNNENQNSDTNTKSLSPEEINELFENSDLGKQLLEDYNNQGIGQTKIEDLEDNKEYETIETPKTTLDYFYKTYSNPILEAKFDTIVRNLKVDKVEKTKAQTCYSYTKYNRKNYNSSIIRPGKVKHNRYNKMNNKNTYEKITLAFVDISASTERMIEDINNLIEKLLNKGCRVITYCHRISRIINPTDKFFYKEKSFGGTDIECVLQEYSRDYEKFSSCVIFTDGKDDFNNLKDYTKHATCYFIDSSDDTITKQFEF